MSVQESPAAPVAAPSGPSALRSVFSSQLTILFFVLIALYVYFGLRNSLFFSTGEMSNLLVNFSGLILLAVAETFVIISGGIDLSVGSTVAVSGVLGAEVMNHYSPIGALHPSMGLPELLLLGTLICALVGVVVGLVNAFLITVIGLVPFVATLVTLSAGVGYALVVSNGGDVGDVARATIWSSQGWWVFKWIALIVIAITIVFAAVLRFTRFGRYTYAIGSNPFAARAAGINIKRHIASVYVLSGLLAGLVGMFFFIRLGAGAPNTGSSANLQAIACVVIGGVALTGGSGPILGTILGCAILTVVGDGLIFVNIPPTWNQVVVGAIIAVAAGLQSLRGVRSRK